MKSQFQYCVVCATNLHVLCVFRLIIVLYPQAHAMHPQLLGLSLSFYAATTQWLVQLVQAGRDEVFPLPLQV